MTLTLLVILCAIAIAGFSLLRPAARGRAKAATSPLMALVGVTSIALVFVVYRYIGFSGSSNLPLESRIRVQQLGFYYQPDEKGITFVGTPIDRDEEPTAFRASALEAGQRLTLAPEGLTTDGRIGSYRITASSLDEPLRNGRELLNGSYGADKQGMKDGSVLRVILPPRGKGEPYRFVALELKQRRPFPRFWTVQPYLIYSQGTWEPISKKATSEGELEIFSRAVEDAASLEDLVARRPGFPREWQERFKTPFELSQTHREVDMGLLASGITLSRELNKTSSEGAEGRLAVIQDPALDVLVLLDGVAVETPKKQSWTLATQEPRVVAVGKGRGTWRLRLQPALAETEKGALARIELVRPLSWPLPPQPEKPLLLSASSQQLPLDGYVFEAVAPANAFHAKAWFRDGFKSLEVADGREGRPYKPDSPIYLGDASKGVIANYSIAQPSPPYTGPLALVFILLHSALIGAALKARRTYGAPEAAVVALWMASMAILIVRLVISYRVAVLPPANAGLNELAIFRSTLPLALFSLALIPLPMIVPLLNSGDKSERGSRGGGPLRSVGLAFDKLLTPLKEPAASAKAFALKWITEGLATWRNRLILLAGALLIFVFSRGDEAVFGLRASMITFCVLVVLIAVEAQRQSNEEGDRPIQARMLYAVAFGLGALATVLSWLGVPFASLLLGLALAIGAVGLVLSRTPLWGIAIFAVLGLVGIVKDIGSSLYILPIFFGVGAAYYQSSQSRVRRTSPWQRRGWIAAFAAIVLLTLNFGALVPQMLQRVPLGSTMYYRLATQHGQDDTVLRDSKELETRLFKQNSQQRWQMLLYAARGVQAKEHGYGDLRLSNVGMTYSTMLTDTLYAVFVMGEHGLFAAVLLLLVYAAICFVCIASAWLMPHGKRHFAAPLIAIGGFYGLQACYMGATNVGELVFTGQNVPLLGLYSKGDVLQSLFLLSFAGYCIVKGLRVLEARQSSAVSPLVWILPILSLGLATATYIGGRALLEPKLGVEDYDLDPKLIAEAGKRIEDGSVALGKNGQIMVDRPEKLTAFERAYVEEYNARTDKGDGRRGLYYLRDDGKLGFNDYGFRLASPYKAAEMPRWKGQLLARRDKNEFARLVYLGKQQTLRVSSTGMPTRVSVGRRGARAPGLTLTRPGSDVAFGEVYSREGKIYLFAKQPGALGQWSFYRDGEKLSYGKEYKLEPYQIVVIRDPRGKRERVYSLLYLGSEGDPLAFVRWVNGGYRRVFNNADSFTLAQSIGEAGDNLGLEEKNVRLSIDQDLQKELHQAVQRWARGNPRFGSNRITAPNISLTVMDPFTGEVLAMPSFPSVDPTGDDLEELREKVQPWRFERLIGNHNFVPHVVGSAIKPITLAALATQVPDLETLIVKGTGKPDADGYLHEELAGVKMLPPRTFPAERSSMPMDDFLIYSYDWPELVLGAIGLATTPEAIQSKLMSGGGETQVTYKGRSSGLDLYRLPEVPLTGPEANPLMRTEAMRRTLLFRGLEDAFSVDTGVRREYAADELADRVKRFFPDMEPRTKDGKIKRNALGSSRLILPYVAPIDAASMQGFGTDYVSFLLGGGDGWNNVVMAQSMARVVSGRKVNATIQKAPLEKAEPMPGDLKDAAWRRKNLTEPLSRVPITGTARSMASFVRELGPYKLALKTGTLAIRKRGPDSETMIFVLGKQDSSGNFIPGKTVVGAFYLEESNAGSMQKFSFAEAVLRPLRKYLGQ